MARMGRKRAVHFFVRSALLDAVKIGDRIRYGVLLLFRQLGVDRQRQDLFGRLFGDRQIAGLSAEISKTLLKVQRARIVDSTADAALLQKRRQVIAALRADDVLVKNMPPV